jgi:hypothetical protein
LEDLNVFPDLFDRFVACGLGLSGFCNPAGRQKKEEDREDEPASDIEITHSESSLSAVRRGDAAADNREKRKRPQKLGYQLQPV